MKILFLTIVLLISSQSFCQDYKGVYLEKTKVDKNNEIYSLGKEFIFKINISQNDKTYFLKSNNHDDFELSENCDAAGITEIYLTVIKPKLFQRTNKNQTEIVYSYQTRPTNISYTGLVENNINVWTHPPRQGLFQALETSPFPYIKLNQPIGFKWTDSLTIGDHWSNATLAAWEGDLMLTYEYEITEKEKVKTNFGEIECTVVNAIAISNIGTSYLKAYFSDDLGFVKLNYIVFNGMEISLILDRVITGPIFRDGKELIKHKLRI